MDERSCAIFAGMTKGNQSWALLAVSGAIIIGLILWRMGLMPGPSVDPPLDFTSEAPAIAMPGQLPEPESAIRHPVGEAPAHPLATGEVVQALVNLLGKDAAETFLQVHEFPRRFVTTVDNLGRSHAPAALWPVHPAPDRLQVVEAAGRAAIGLDNGSRYTPFVLLAESVNAARAVDLYVRMYPLLQRAYENLGFPNSYFNDRLVAVIDLLLATPEPAYPVPLQLTEVKGPIPSLRPWVRYEFADPAIESLASGQKILVRVGPVNQRRLKAKLVEIRAELVARATRR